MKILIGGGAGYIGSRLSNYLAEKGQEVVVADLLWFGNNLRKDIPIIQKDIFHIGAADLKGIEQVIFMAGLSNDPMAEYSPSLNFIFNAAAPAHLAYVAKQAGVKRFIYAGSCSVYGYLEGGAMADEDSRATSSYPYGISKLQGELSVMQLSDDNFSVICLRQGTVSGWSPRMRFDLILNTMFMNAVLNGTIVVNNPAIHRPILGIKDAIQAYEKAMLADYKVSGIFNLCSENLTVGDAAERAAGYLEKARGLNIKIEKKNLPDLRSYRASNKKAGEVLGVKFSESVESILKELDEHFDKDFNFHDDKHHNIKVFKKLFPQDNVKIA